MASHGIIGREGSGKSFVMASIAGRALDRGWPVFANFYIDGVTQFTADDMWDLPPGFVLLDEASNWFHSRRWSQTGDQFLDRINQTRKAGWELFVGTQHEANMDSVIRRKLQFGWLLEARWSALTVVDPRVRALRDARVAEMAGSDYGRRPGTEPRIALSMCTHPLYIYGRKWDFEVFRGKQKGRRPLQRRRWWWSWQTASSYDTKEIMSGGTHHGER